LDGFESVDGFFMRTSDDEHAERQPLEGLRRQRDIRVVLIMVDPLPGAYERVDRVTLNG
jgi:hypothetical protein